jgi:TRAP-type mannitol/chloroaromatic compound transport system permease large subunit
MRKELWFGFSIMALIAIPTLILMPWGNMTQGHLGLLMLALVVIAIMLGFPTAFTLMGMGMLFAWFAFDFNTKRTLDLMVQRTYAVMTNDVLISIPLFVFMGYLVERANLIEKLFKSLHLALARVPGSLAVATLVTCAIFATATGIVGAVVTLMGLLALPAMLRAGYSVQLSAGAITAGGCLGILIPPSVMLIVYGATAGVSVVQLYAGAFFPGLLLTLLYIGYVIIIAKLKPALAPALSQADRTVPLPAEARAVSAAYGVRLMPALMRALRGTAGVPGRWALRQLLLALLPAVAFVLIMGLSWNAITKPDAAVDTSGLQEMGSSRAAAPEALSPGGVQEPPKEEPPQTLGVQEPPREEAVQPLGVQEPPKDLPASAGQVAPPAVKPPSASAPAADGAKSAGAAVRAPTPKAFWIVLGAGLAALAVLYAMFNFVRLEIFKMLLASFFPLAFLILAVLGSIVFGLATPTEAAAIGSLGGLLLAAVYMALARPANEARRIFKLWVPLWMLASLSVIWFILLKFEVLASAPPVWMGWVTIAAVAVWCGIAIRQVNLGPTLKESAFLTAKTSAMVCWLFVGSSIFSAAFALLGGQDIIEKWVLSLGLTPVQFMILAQAIIFILGWPLEWTEIIVIFMPIFIPLLAKFNIDPLFFGLLVALNLQTAFLSPPVAMAAFYLKGVAPPHVTLNQIFVGMLPFMAIQVLALALLYLFPQIGLWLPHTLYK